MNTAFSNTIYIITRPSVQKNETGKKNEIVMEGLLTGDARSHIIFVASNNSSMRSHAKMRC